MHKNANIAKSLKKPGITRISASGSRNFFIEEERQDFVTSVAYYRIFAGFSVWLGKMYNFFPSPATLIAFLLCTIKANNGHGFLHDTSQEMSITAHEHLRKNRNVVFLFTFNDILNVHK